MAGVHGTRLYGEVDRVPELFAVSTMFWHINYLPLIPTGSYLVLEGSQSDESFRGKSIGLSPKSIIVGYVRGWSAGVAMFAAGVAGLGGLTFFTGNQGAGMFLAALAAAVALALGFWYVIASRSWVRAALVYALLLAVSVGAVWAVERALQQNPALRQARANEIACLPGLLVAHIAVLVAALTRPLNGCSYERALALAKELSIDPNAIASRYGAIPLARDQFFPNH